MEDAFAFADSLGPEKIVHIYRPKLGLRAVVAIDNVACGPAIGGVRMARDVSATEAFRLARAMTLKNAAAGLAHGGGKSVIFGDPAMPAAEKEILIRAFASSIAELTEYIPGPDMGTDERAMAWIQDETGRSVGLPREIGGIPLDEIGATGWGLVAAIDVAQEFANLSIKGARLAIQGFGSVGKHAARFLGDRGAVLVAASDTHGTLYDPNGLDIAKLIALKGQGQPLTVSEGGKKLPLDAILDVDCDIWIPAARPDVLRADTAARIKARLVAQGANIPATAEAEKLLDERGVVVLPDFIANAGGVICAAVEYHGGTETAAMAAIEEKIRANTAAVLEAASRDKILPRAAAIRLAESRVRRAMALRRW